MLKKVTSVVDPVGLLTKDEWKKVFSNKPTIKDKYVFSYVLGYKKKERTSVKQFWKKFGYKLITFPYSSEEFRFWDLMFDKQYSYDTGVQDFLNAIYFSSLIFTDSFHAMMFSIIFNKEFYVFPRTEKLFPANNERMKDILNMLDCKDRYINFEGNNKSIFCGLNTKKINYKKVNKKFEDYVHYSRNLLLNGLIIND